jgi:uncharacterized protein (TIGR02466 family)
MPQTDKCGHGNKQNERKYTNMRTEVFGLFPTPMLKLKYDKPFTQDELNFMYNAESETTKPPFAIHLGNVGTESKRILENPEMANIKAYLEKCLDQWCKQVMIPIVPEAVKLKITQSWLNYTKPGEHHGRHYHPNSIVSGVLYINADERYDMISFVKSGYDPFFIKSGEFNQFNTTEVNINIGKQDIVLFPSIMHHHVPKTTTNYTRVSLAFNTFYEGQIGNPNDLPNYLEINSVR